jgi:hypothetical protein
MTGEILGRFHINKNRNGPKYLDNSKKILATKGEQ